MAVGGGFVVSDGGDRFERLYRDEYAAAVRLAHLLVGDRARAEELAQDAFVRILPKLGQADNPGGYLRTILVNLCRDHQRREARARRLPASQVVYAAPPGTPETSSDLWRAVQQLPDRQRQALILRFYLDLPTDEIARLLDARPATVRSLIHRGIAALEKVVPRD